MDLVIPPPPAGMENPMMNKQKHMDIEARRTIEDGLNRKESFKQIGLSVGKDCTTISKEVRKHRVFESTGSCGKAFNDCEQAYLRLCDLRHVCDLCTADRRPCWSCGLCTKNCSSYKKKICSKLTKSPYVCNACTDRGKCSLEKAYYRSHRAQKEYSLLLSESRSGFAISQEELKQLDKVVSPLLRKGQSLHHISLNHADEVMKSERTLYTYVNNGLISARNLDMPRTVRMRPRKTKSKALKVDKTCRIGRTYPEYIAFLDKNPDISTVQLDSVEGIKGSSVLLTVHFVQPKLQLAFIRSANDSQSVIDIFDRLYLELRPDIFMEIFPLLLADNGSEFSNPRAIEYDRQGNQRTRMYYCNPNAPYEKPQCENNHEMVRRCIPKGVDIGRYTQPQISLMMSHINSYARKALGNKSPYDIFEFQYGKGILEKLGLSRILPDEIMLSPELFK